MTCVFCEIVKNGNAVGFEAHGRMVVSFFPLNPVTQGHRLFVPVTHNISAAEGSANASLAFHWAAIWGRDEDEEFNIITSAGANATQTVFHTHIHYVPRHKGDGLKLPWSDQ